MKVFILCVLVALAASNAMKSEVEEIFEKMDGDQNGILTLEEMYAYFDLLDSNSDGKWTLSEYAGMMEGSEIPADVKKRFKYYDMLDGNEDNLTERSSIAIFFHMLDSNDDQEVTLDEFTAVWNELVAPILVAMEESIL